MGPSKPSSGFGNKAVITTATIAAFCTLATATDAEAKVTAFFSVGSTCAGVPSASYEASGSTVKMSLCVKATTETLCGYTAKLQAADMRESGRFKVTSVAFGANYSDPNSDLTFPIAITHPAAMSDFGATVSRTGVTTTASQLLETFDISPQTDTKTGTYAISLAPTSSVGVSMDNTCSMPTDAPIDASFKLIQRPGKTNTKEPSARLLAPVVDSMRDCRDLAAFSPRDEPLLMHKTPALVRFSEAFCPEESADSGV